MKRFLAAALAATLCVGIATAQDLKPLNSDSEPDRMDWSQLEAKFGAPVYRDDALTVFALAPVSPLGNNDRPVQQ